MSSASRERVIALYMLWKRRALVRSAGGLISHGIQRCRSNSPLVNSWSHPVVVFAGHNDFRDLKCSKVAQSKLYELPRLMKLIDRRQRLCERQAAIRSMQIEDINTVSP